MSFAVNNSSQTYVRMPLPPPKISLVMAARDAEIVKINL